MRRPVWCGPKARRRPGARCYIACRSHITLETQWPAQPHGVVALVSRCEEAGLVKRKPSSTDRRQVEVHLLAAGRKKLETLAALHKDQVAKLAKVVALVNKDGA